MWAKAQETHCNMPGTFPVGFVIVGEAFTSKITRICNKMTTTEKHWPEERDRNGEKNMGYFYMEILVLITITPVLHKENLFMCSYY